MKYQHVENFPNINSWEIIDNNCYYASGNLVKVIGKEICIPIPLPYWGVEFNPSFLMCLLIGVSILFLIIKEKL